MRAALAYPAGQARTFGSLGSDVKPPNEGSAVEKRECMGNHTGSESRALLLEGVRWQVGAASGRTGLAR